jgi:hypothetical protein
MPTTYKILGQSAPSTTSNANAYTVPSATSAVVSTIVVANTTTSSATCRVFARISGAAASAANAIVYDATITPNSTTALTLGITLATTDILTVQSSVANALTFTVFGSEIS